MSKQLREQTRQKLAQSDLRRLASLGQNFLVDQKIIDSVCQVVTETKPAQILEIGPGLGAVTFPLTQAVKEIVAVELDRGLADRLARIAPTNVRLVNGDILKQNLANFGLNKGKYVAFGSLPFNVGTAIIRFLLESPVRPRLIYAILQQEVIDRILAKDQGESVLSLAVKFYGQAEFRLAIPASAYEPVPQVKTGLVSLDCAAGLRFPELEKPYFRLVKAGFASRRKFLASNLTAKLGVERKIVQNAFIRAKIKLTARAEELSFLNWIDLARFFYERNLPDDM